MTTEICDDCGEPFCDLCEQPFLKVDGCSYPDDMVPPVLYGEELHPLSQGDRCRDCGARKGYHHHGPCLCSECSKCHGQYGLCFARDCEAMARLTGQEAPLQ